MALAALVGAGVLALPSAASAARVDLGTAGSFSVLGGSAVTNTGPTTMPGDLGVDPSFAVTGFPPGLVGGTVHAADAVAGRAQADLGLGYDDARGRPSTTTIVGDLGGRTLPPGVHTAPTSLGLTGDLTLDADGDPDAVFVLRAGSTLTTASGSRVLLTGGAQACNVFWQVGSSATLGTSSTFVGSILALTSISLTTDARIDGRVLARGGAVTLDSNTFTSSACTTGGGAGTGSGGAGGTGGGGSGGTGAGGEPATTVPPVVAVAPALVVPGPAAPLAPTPGAPAAGPAPVAGPATAGGTAPRVPRGQTLAPSVVGATKAEVQASMGPGGAAVTYRWEYGSTGRYGRRSPMVTAPPASSTRRLRGTIRGLRPCTGYHYRVAVRRPDGRWTFGRDRRFRTAGCALARLPRTSSGFTG